MKTMTTKDQLTARMQTRFAMYEKAILKNNDAISAGVGIAAGAAVGTYVGAASTTIVVSVTPIAGAIATQKIIVENGVLYLCKVSSPLWFKIFLGLAVGGAVAYITYMGVSMLIDQLKK